MECIIISRPQVCWRGLNDIVNKSKKVTVGDTRDGPLEITGGLVACEPQTYFLENPLKKQNKNNNKNNKNELRAVVIPLRRE